MRFNHPAAATAFRAVARTFGEAVRIVPLRESEYAEALPDPARAPVDARAVVSLTPAMKDFDGARTGSGKASTMTRLSVRRANLWFSAEAYAALGYPLRAGDRILLTERPGEPAFTVSRVPVASDRGDVSVNLVQEGCE